MERVFGENLFFHSPRICETVCKNAIGMVGRKMLAITLTTEVDTERGVKTSVGYGGFVVLC